MSVASLPDLERPCPDCTGPEADKAREEDQAAYGKWADEENDAFIAYTNGPDAPRWDAHLSWKQTDTYCELRNRKPEEVPEVGCFECDYTGKVPTEAGAQILAFVRSRS